MTNYLYDATSGFYYDPETTLYYDPTSRVSVGGNSTLSPNENMLLESSNFKAFTHQMCVPPHKKNISAARKTCNFLDRG